MGAIKIALMAAEERDSTVYNHDECLLASRSFLFFFSRVLHLFGHLKKTSAERNELLKDL
jgi:hypothetical protein